MALLNTKITIPTYTASEENAMFRMGDFNNIFINNLHLFKDTANSSDRLVKKFFLNESDIGKEDYVAYIKLSCNTSSASYPITISFFYGKTLIKSLSYNINTLCNFWCNGDKNNHTIIFNFNNSTISCFPFVIAKTNDSSYSKVLLFFSSTTSIIIYPNYTFNPMQPIELSFPARKVPNTIFSLSALPAFKDSSSSFLNLYLVNFSPSSITNFSPDSFLSFENGNEKFKLAAFNNNPAASTSLAVRVV